MRWSNAFIAVIFLSPLNNILLRSSALPQVAQATENDHAKMHPQHHLSASISGSSGMAINLSSAYPPFNDYQRGGKKSLTQQ
jgi:hypothetical protein